MLGRNGDAADHVDDAGPRQEATDRSSALGSIVGRALRPLGEGRGLFLPFTMQ